MKKNFKFYALIWVILLAVFCAVVCLARSIIPGYVVRYDARFWIAFAFITAAFICNIICAAFAFKAENRGRTFLNVALITVSWTSLIFMLVVGIILMLIPNFPAWITAIICIIVSAINVIAYVKAGWAVNAVDKVDNKVRIQTAFLKNTTINAESILENAKSDEIKAECKKVCEAVRYSDPMSNEYLKVIESKISAKMGELSTAVRESDAEKVKQTADEIIILIKDRNTKCKALKG